MDTAYNISRIRYGEDPALDACIKVASFNIKRDSRFQGTHSWQYRRELVADIIRKSGLAIIGVQELLPTMREDLHTLLQDYSIFGDGRKRNRSNEQSAILLRDHDTRLLGGQTFWLSKHPEQSGSRAYFSMFPRICTVCEVFVQEYGRSIRVFNTHFDHICSPARTLGVRIILEYMHRMNERSPMPCILMGDLNAAPDSKPIRILRENRHTYPDIHLNCAYDLMKNRASINTYHGFTGRITPRPPIDYIFVSDEFVIKDTYLDTTHTGELYPSDHFPLVAELGLKKQEVELAG